MRLIKRLILMIICMFLYIFSANFIREGLGVGMCALYVILTLAGTGILIIVEDNKNE